jgi:hypothetical protein
VLVRVGQEVQEVPRGLAPARFRDLRNVRVCRRFCTRACPVALARRGASVGMATRDGKFWLPSPCPPPTPTPMQVPAASDCCPDDRVLPSAVLRSPSLCTTHKSIGETTGSERLTARRPEPNPLWPRAFRDRRETSPRSAPTSGKFDNCRPGRCRPRRSGGLGTNAAGGG